MNIVIVSDPYKDPEETVEKELCSYLKTKAVSYKVFHRDGPRLIQKKGEGNFAKEDSDLMMSLGGDGTFLEAVHLMGPILSRAAIIGVNLGSVGFLTEIMPAELKKSVDRLLSKEYKILERMLLRVRAVNSEGESFFFHYALNEALLSRGASERIIPVRLNFDGDFIETVRCDGILCSTPTGSTAYAMAAGGPITHPSLELLQISSVCPYSLQNRTYILNPDTKIEFSLTRYPQLASISVDGRSQTSFRNGDRLIISRAEEKLKCIVLDPKHFFADLPGKLRGRAGTENFEEDLD